MINITRSRYFVVGLSFLISLVILHFFWQATRAPTTPFHASLSKPSSHLCLQAENLDPQQNPTSGKQVEGFLPLQEAEQLCTSHGLKVFQDRDRPRKVYDLFLFSNEYDWLEIRVNELFPQVDHFILLEAKQTFSGNDKPLYFRENEKCLSALVPEKLVYHALDLAERDFGVWKPAWNREQYARNALFTEVFPLLVGDARPNKHDVILVSDVDEVPRLETIQVLRNCEFPKRTNLRSRFFYYSYQWQHHSKDWEHPQVTWYDGEETILPNDLRWGHKNAEWNFDNSSWHCSSCFATVEEMDFKIASFSHQEFNKEEFRDPAQIVRKVRNGLDLFDRAREKYDKLDPVTDYPSYLRTETNKKRFEYMLNRDPENANFQDFP